MAGYKKLKIKGVTVDEHRFIMANHLGRALDRYECVHHKNGDGKDNQLDNLELISLSEHSRMHMTGEGNSSAILTISEVLEIRRSPTPIKRLAKQYGVAKKTIQDIKHRRTWSHL